MILRSVGRSWNSKDRRHQGADRSIASKSFNQALFAIELDGVSWDFGALEFDDVTIVSTLRTRVIREIDLLTPIADGNGQHKLVLVQQVTEQLQQRGQCRDLRGQRFCQREHRDLQDIEGGSAEPEVRNERSCGL